MLFAEVEKCVLAVVMAGSEVQVIVVDMPSGWLRAARN
jgi:hypothetical protein